MYLEMSVLGAISFSVLRHFKHKLNFYYILNPNKIKQLKNGETHFPFFAFMNDTMIPRYDYIIYMKFALCVPI